MTVKDLRDKLQWFDGDLIIMIPKDGGDYDPLISIARGCNEADGCLFLDGFGGD